MSYYTLYPSSNKENRNKKQKKKEYENKLSPLSWSLTIRSLEGSNYAKDSRIYSNQAE